MPFIFSKLMHFHNKPIVQYDVFVAELFMKCYIVVIFEKKVDTPGWSVLVVFVPWPEKHQFIESLKKI